MNATLRCRKCRHVLINQEETSFLDPHNNIQKELDNKVIYDCGNNIVDVWYLKENEVPQWILHCVNKADWQKGKLVCPQCNSRIGSFDFISGSKCSCKQYLIAPIHIVKSKADLCVK